MDLVCGSLPMEKFFLLGRFRLLRLSLRARYKQGGFAVGGDLRFW